MESECYTLDICILFCVICFVYEEDRRVSYKSELNCVPTVADCIVFDNKTCQ
jgi:hypothetical protein